MHAPSHVYSLSIARQHTRGLELALGRSYMTSWRCPTVMATAILLKVGRTKTLGTHHVQPPWASTDYLFTRASSFYRSYGPAVGHV